MTREITGLREVAADYTALIVDLWGVVIDGITAFSMATDCLSRWREDGKSIAFVSNTSRSSANTVALLGSLGVTRRHFDLLLTSGELASSRLRGAHGYGSYLRLGSEANTEWLTTCDIRETNDVEKADVIIVTGVLETAVVPGNLMALLRRARERDLPMLCTNPDRTVYLGDGRVLGVGTLADYYEHIGGDVTRFGKPEPPVYDVCLADSRFGDIRQVLAIGDSLETDIRGGQRVGLDTLLVTGTGVGRGDGEHRTTLGSTPVPLLRMEALTW